MANGDEPARPPAADQVADPDRSSEADDEQSVEALKRNPMKRFLKATLVMLVFAGIGIGLIAATGRGDPDGPLESLLLVSGLASIAMALMGSGGILVTGHNYHEVVAAYDRKIERAVQRGESARREGDLSQAIHHLIAAIELEEEKLSYLPDPDSLSPDRITGNDELLEEIDAARTNKEQLRKRKADVIRERKRERHRPRLEEHHETARQNVEQADQHRDDGEYERARSAYQQALAEYDAAREVVEEAGLDEARRRIVAERDEAETKLARTLAGAAEARTSEADALVERGNFPAAKDAYQRAYSHYQDALPVAREQGFGDEILAAAEDVQGRFLDSRLSQLGQWIEEASDRTTSEPGWALDRFEAIRGALDELEDDRPRDVEPLREHARLGTLHAHAERGRTLADGARTAFEEGDHREARDAFEDARAALEEALAVAEEFDFVDELPDLERRAEACAANADAARRALFDVGDAAPELRSFDDVRDDGAEVGERRPENRRGSAPAPETPVDGDGESVPGTGTLDDQLLAELPEHEVLERVGTGGQADVYRIRLADAGSVAALKVPRWRGTLTRDVMEQFTREAETWATLDDHEGIVDVLDWGATPFPWLLMEYLDGGNLAERMDDLAEREAAVALRAVCEALDHAHRHGVAHLDVTPENVLFDADDGRAKVADWGLARVLLEHPRDVAGMSLPYAAPEQLDSAEYGHPDTYTDIYQLGAVAYRVLTGRTPIQHDDRSAAVSAILQGNVPSPTEQRPDLPSVLDDVLLQAMAPRKTDRYESVLYLRDDLREALA